MHFYHLRHIEWFHETLQKVQKLMCIRRWSAQYNLMFLVIRIALRRMVLNVIIESITRVFRTPPYSQLLAAQSGTSAAFVFAIFYYQICHEYELQQILQLNICNYGKPKLKVTTIQTKISKSLLLPTKLILGLKLYLSLRVCKSRY